MFLGNNISNLIKFQPKLANLEYVKLQILDNNVVLTKIFKFWYRVIQILNLPSNPLFALRSSRFDIVAKTLFGRAILSQNQSSFPEEVYSEHLRVWNGFFEISPKKTSKSEYIESFKKILESQRLGSFDPIKSPVPMTFRGEIVNGSHRVASAILQRRKLVFKRFEFEPYEQYNYEFFLKRGLQENFLDAMALEYLRTTNRKIHVVMLSPTIDQENKEVLEILEQVSRVVYEKRINISSDGALNLIHQTYFGEPWVNRQDQSGLISKTLSFFGSRGSTHKLRAILIETDKPLKEITKAKESIRLLLGSHHAIHITDHKRDTSIVSKMLFNSNSLHLINHQKLITPTPRFDELLLEYSQHPLSEERCIDSGGVLAAYGLRDVGDDLDYLYRHDGRLKKESPGRISNHLSESMHYSKSIDEIITDPINHFYYLGLKFASLRVVGEMKIKRNEPKDLEDLMLINSIPEEIDPLTMPRP
jgi:hypothetical protein